MAYIYLFIHLLHLFLAWGYPISDNTASMGAQGANKLHQKAKTLHIRYTNS